jgi:hypothetical protein
MRDSKEPKQKTPKGYEIPIPKRVDVDRALKKAAQPLKPRRSKDKSPK